MFSWTLLQHSLLHSCVNWHSIHTISILVFLDSPATMRVPTFPNTGRENISILVFLDSPATSRAVVHGWWNVVVFQSLFSWTLLQHEIDFWDFISPINFNPCFLGLSCNSQDRTADIRHPQRNFNPCFLRLFCNMKTNGFGRLDFIVFQSLFS